VAHFVEQHKERIAEDKFHPINPLLFGEVLETWIFLERPRKVFHPRLERWSRWSRLRGGRSAAEQQHAHHDANGQITPRCSHCERSSSLPDHRACGSRHQSATVYALIGLLSSGGYCFAGGALAEHR
jgi:hypothetical protein